MDLALPEDVAAQLEQCNAVLESLEEKAKPFLNRSVKDVDAQLDPVERAQVYQALAQTINRLFELYLKASGSSPEDHGTEKEKERANAFDKKVRKVVAEKELSESRRSLEVNVAALNRVITHAVPDLSTQQRQALKQASNNKQQQQQSGDTGGEQELTPGEHSGQQQPAAGGSRKKQRRGAGRDEALAFLEETMAEIQGTAGAGKPAVGQCG